MSRNFIDVLDDSKRRSWLSNFLIRKTEGRLLKEEIEKVIDEIDIGKKYTIEIIQSAKEMAERMILSKEESGEVFLGDNFKFGDKKSLPNFNVYEKYVIVITENKELVRVCGRKKKEKYLNNNYLVIYIPESEPYQLSSEVKYILGHFDIKN